MQFIKSVALPVALVASLATAAPIQVSSDNKLSVRSQPTLELLTDAQVETRSESPEKRLGWGKLAAGGAAAVVGWLTSKEGQDFLDSDEGLDFVSKLALNDDEEETPSKRLNAAAMIGLTGGSILKGVFGSKEAADVFLNSPDGEEFISKLALDDEESTPSPSKRLNTAAMAGLTGGSLLKGIFDSKEGQDFLNSDEGLDFVSKLALNDDDILSARDVDFDDAASLERRLNFKTGFKAGLKVFGGLFDDDDD